MGRLDDRVAIVTGGGSGNGLAIARRFAAEGARVVIAEYSEERGREAVATINEADGDAHFVHADVSKWEDVDRAVSAAVERFGRLDVMVNNAGVLDGYTTCLETSEELFTRVITLNLTSVFFGCKRALAEMVPAGYGKIINVASIAGLQAKAGGTSYTASKHGVIGLTKQLACDYGAVGVRTNALCPGPVSTNLRATSTSILGEIAPDMSGGLAVAPEDFIRQLIPIGRMALVDEVADGALFLASSESDYMNGHSLVLDGGISAK